MTALVLVSAAAAVVALVELTIRAHQRNHRRRRDDRGTTTYWYRGEPITRHDYDALTHLHDDDLTTDPTTTKDQP